jgi:energy-coupling factor transporter ATP-binding protein EcfA2
VLVNGRDLSRGLDALRSAIGFVPQDDIVHRELTVAECLDYAARLRLPPDTQARERARRSEAVLATLELSDRADQMIQRLSGGQRKRVSIATELLTEPSLIFLDEPAAGLDPGLEEALMLLLRELSYKGKTVVLVTHSLEHVDLCDNVALLVGGRLAYVGRPDELLAHFGIDRLPHLYPRLREKRPDAWQNEFRASDAYRARVVVPLSQAAPAPAPGPAPALGASPLRTLRQLGVLTSRYLRTLTRDARNAALLVAQAPIIAGLIGLSLLYGASDLSFTKPRNTILFLLALTAVWFGCSNAIREVVKERAIYLRERMVNLGLLPYLASKLGVLSLLALVQCVVLLLVLDLWFVLPGNPLLLLLGMLAVSVVGILLGLGVSCLAATADRAMTLLPILLIPQVLFTIPAVQMDMKGPAGVVARAMPTWWGYDLMRRIALASEGTESHEALAARLESGASLLMTRERFESMFRAGYPVFEHRARIEITWSAALPERLARLLPTALGRARAPLVDTLVLAAMAGALALAATLFLRRLDRRE